MDWITLESLRTTAGASLAVTLATQAVKGIVPAINGGWTNVTALVLSFAVAGATGRWDSYTSGLLTVLNGILIFGIATGISKVVSYKREAQT